MDLKEVMDQKNFVVVGDTLSEDKYAHKIKRKLTKKGYNVYCVGKELASINDVDAEIDVIDLCINPAKGLEYIKECEKPFKTIVIQPGAESQELVDYLKENKMPYMQNCLLVGLREFRQ